MMTALQFNVHLKNFMQFFRYHGTRNMQRKGEIINVRNNIR